MLGVDDSWRFINKCSLGDDAIARNRMYVNESSLVLLDRIGDCFAGTGLRVEKRHTTLAKQNTV